MDLGLNDQTAIVIGGASGIGLATVKQFLEEGASVEIWDRSSKVESVANALQEDFDKGLVRGRQVDITSELECNQAAALARQANPSIHHVVHAAAIGSGKFGFPFTNLQPPDWPRVLEVNIMGMVHVVHALTPILRENSQGSFVFLGSVAGQIGSQTDPPYSASKAANINFMQCIAKDLAPYNIRANVVNPGMVKTPLNQGVWQAWHDQQTPENRKSYEEWAGDKVKNVIPLKRWQTPEDIAAMIVFLCSSRAASITGQTLNVDGGFVMHW